MSQLKDMDAIDICVPTPLRKTKDPDLSYVVQAVDSVKAHLKRGQLVILESTTYPGTTDEVVQPALEENGLKAGEDFYLAFSPERVDPGNESFSTRTIPKVVGGVNNPDGADDGAVTLGRTGGASQDTLDLPARRRCVQRVPHGVAQQPFRLR